MRGCIELYIFPSYSTVRPVANRNELQHEILHTFTFHSSWLLLYSRHAWQGTNQILASVIDLALPYSSSNSFFSLFIPFSIWSLKTECHSISTGFRLIIHWWHALWLRWLRHNSFAAPFRWVLTLGKYDVLLTVQQNKALCEN